jgi:methylphosphotriester-DNA--protein-cysteine methyltransferase
MPLMFTAKEKHYKIPELAKQWNMDAKTVRKLFKGKVGVVHKPNPATRNKRAYTALWIPESMANAVYAGSVKYFV